MELRNGVHKYQPIILAAGSIAPVKAKSTKIDENLRVKSHNFRSKNRQNDQNPRSWGN